MKYKIINIICITIINWNGTVHHIFKNWILCFRIHVQQPSRSWQDTFFPLSTYMSLVDTCCYRVKIKENKPLKSLIPTTNIRAYIVGFIFILKFPSVNIMSHVCFVSFFITMASVTISSCSSLCEVVFNIPTAFDDTLKLTLWKV